MPMQIESLQARTLAIPLNLSFRHAAAERSATQSLWIDLRSTAGVTGIGEGCPREYVSGESMVTAHEFVLRHRAAWQAAIHDLDSLRDWSRRHAAEVDDHPAAWAAVELALLDCLAKSDGVPVEALLGLPVSAGRFQCTAVLGDSDTAAFEKQLARYTQAGFDDFKIKLSGDLTRDRAKVFALRTVGASPQRVRADANNVWAASSEAACHLAALDFPFLALEEPLRAGDFDGLRELSRALDTPIVLDESVLKPDDLELLQGEPDRWIVNIRVSKMGGLIRSLATADEAKRLGLRIIVGAHVGETSVLTRAALAVAKRAGDRLVAQEGAFGTHLLAHDMTEPPLMCGFGGILDLARADSPGLGLTRRLDSAPAQPPGV